MPQFHTPLIIPMSRCWNKDANSLSWYYAPALKEMNYMQEKLDKMIKKLNNTPRRRSRRLERQGGTLPTSTNPPSTTGLSCFFPAFFP